MGLFNKNNNDDEILKVLGEIRDNLDTNNADRLEERFDKIARQMENRCIDYKHSNDEEIGVLHNQVNELTNMVEYKNKQITDLYQRYEELDKDHIETRKTVRNQEEQITELINAMSKILKIINKPKKAEKKTKPHSRDYSKVTNSKTVKNTYRKIKKNYNINMSNISGLNNKGKFEKTNAGKKFKWDIHDIIQIKNLIPKVKEYPTVTSIAKETKLSTATVSDLVYLIENGYFDKYLNEWEQMEANRMFNKYGDWKPQIQNNPEKRQEAGIYGAK